MRLAIGEAPGAEEAASGLPFVGGSGKLLDAMLGKAGIKRSELTVINCIQCQPKNNVFPTDSDARSYISAEDAYAAVAQCQKNHVEPVLKARPWRRVDLLGEKPLRFVAQKDGGIHRWRGSPLPIPAIHPTQPMTVPTLHPAGLMRDQSLIPIAVNDLRKDLAVPPEDYNLSPSLADVRAFTATTFAFDIETPYAGRTWEKTDIFMVGLSAKATTAMVVPFTGAYIDELKRVFRNAKEVIGHNCLQFDLPVLEKFGVVTTAKVHDTMLYHHLRFPSLSGDERTGGGHDLAFVASQLCQKPAWKHLKESEQLYCARDVDATMQVFNALKPLCADHKLLELYEYVQVPLAKICYLMHKTGIKLDPSRIDEVRVRLLSQMAKEELKLPEQMRSFDRPINKRELAPPGTLSPKTRRPVKYIMVATTERVVPWRSTMMKQAFLYGSAEPWHLGLPVQLDAKKDTVTTGKFALDKLKKKAKSASAAAAIDALKKLNQMDETISTFCKSEMKEMARQHSSFNLQGTSSGRLSSSDVNLQNIPDPARVVYTATNPGDVLIECDYSGIENRLTAWFAGDTARLKRLEDNPDFSEHRYLASVIEGIPYDEIEKNNSVESPYGKAKRIVHGPWVPEAQVLTPDGWLPMADYADGTPIAEWEEGRITFRKPRAVLWDETNELVEWDSNYFKACVTPDHGFPVTNWKDERLDCKARDLNGNYTAFLTGQFDFGGDDGPDVRLAAAIQADGSLYGRSAVFHLRRPRKMQRLEEILGDRPYTKQPCGCHEEGYRYRVPAQVVEPALWILSDKNFNANILSLTKAKAQELLDEVFHWDGSRPKVGGRLYFNTSKTSATWVHTLAHLLGKRAYFREERHWRGGLFYRVYVSDHHTTARIPSAKAHKILDKPQRVVCFSTEAGYFLVRYKDTIVVSCNSNYGMGAQKIVRLFDMDFQETKDMLFKWKSEIKPTIDWQNGCAELAKKQSWLVTPFGRKRWFYTDSYYTEALSFLPQSTAADVIYRAMIGLMYERINWPKELAQKVCPVLWPLPARVNLLVQIHDALLFECPKEMVDEVVAGVKRVMEQPWSELKGMVLPVGVAVGDSWGTVEKYKLKEAA